MHWKSGSDEFMVVYHTHAIGINLRKDVLELIFTQTCMAIADCSAQLVNAYHT